MNLKVKALLYSALVRSKLVYGFECADLNWLDKLCALESTQIKICFQLSKFSKTKILLYAMHTSPMKIYLLKRKLNFLKQLANNEATADLLVCGCHHSVKDILDFLDIDYERDYGGERGAYLSLIMKKCFHRVREIIQVEKAVMKSEIVRCIRYLLNNRNAANDDTAQFLLDPRRYKEG
jgi:hypothetical protein